MQAVNKHNIIKKDKNMFHHLVFINFGAVEQYLNILKLKGKVTQKIF